MLNQGGDGLTFKTIILHQDLATQFQRSHQFLFSRCLQKHIIEMVHIYLPSQCKKKL